MFAILVLLQAWTGYTPGKLVMGIAVVRDETGLPAGLARTILRLVAHLLDSILLIGYLRPLWHPRRQTFADSLLGTVVVLRRPALPPAQRRVLTGVALVVCVLGLCFGCFPFYGARSVAGETVTCVPVTGDDTTTTRTLSLTPSSHWLWERRLWVRRHAPAELALDVNWSWLIPAGAGLGGGYDVEIAVAAPGGDDLPGSPWSVGLHQLPHDDMGLEETGEFSDGRLTGRHDLHETPAGTVHTVALRLADVPVPDGADALAVTVRLLAVNGQDREAASCSTTVPLGGLRPTP